ncbi:MAG: hypothetical protein PHV20_04975 [Bacteroidales bacterium]|nr:hypothetical protein [Bacteroidales bacterium]
MIRRFTIFLLFLIPIQGFGQKMVAVLDMVKQTQIKKSFDCNHLDFIVLNSDYTGVYFSMGCAWDTEKLYWIKENDSIFFYQPDLKVLIENAQIGNQQELVDFIRTNGTIKRIGNIAFGFDYLVLVNKNEFKPISRAENKIDYVYQWNEKLKTCNQKYYDQIFDK